MEQTSPNIFVAGADGCKSGWFVVVRDLSSGAVVSPQGA